jgi:hypothetical protein
MVGCGWTVRATALTGSRLKMTGFGLISRLIARIKQMRLGDLMPA